MADSSGFYFYGRLVFVYLHFRPIPKLRKKNRSLARTVTKRGKVHTATFSANGEASGRAWKSAG
jgi:hypothetical protein